MTHKMKLDDVPFQNIKKGTKKIELRLNDEKRQKVKENDIIEFINRTTNESIKAKIIKLHVFKNFEELYKHFDKKDLGYDEREKASPKDMEKYYKKEEQDQYGVVAIKIQKI